MSHAKKPGINIGEVDHRGNPALEIQFSGKRCHAKGVHCNGSRVIVRETGKSIAIKDIEIIKHAGAWAAA